MNNGFKITGLIIILLLSSGCKKEDKESNPEEETPFHLIDESLGSASSLLYLTSDEYVLLGSGEVANDFADLQLTKIDSDLNKIWTKSYTRPFNNFSKQVLKTDDGFMLLSTGTESAFGANDLDILIIKTDEQGEELWSNYYGGEGSDQGGLFLNWKMEASLF